MALLASNMKESDFLRTVWVADIPDKTTLEDVLKPSDWAHVSQKLKPWDRIEVRAADGSWCALLHVAYTERATAKVELMEEYRFDETAGDAVPEFIVKWAGPTAKFRVERADDKAVIRDGFESKEQAYAFLKDHLKALAA